MKKRGCSLYEDLLPLYKEHEVQEDTHKLIEEHLQECRSCAALYAEVEQGGAQPILAQFELAEPNLPQEKPFLLKLKRTLIGVVATGLVIFIATNGVAYTIGKNRGIYEERFQLAEEKNLFLEVNQEVSFGNEKILLEKVLFDSTVTSLIFQTSLDLNDLDSITLKDEQDCFYQQTHTYFNAVPLKYQQEKGYTVLNFQAIPENVQELCVELINWREKQPENVVGEKAVFQIKVKPELRQNSIAERENVFVAKLADLTFAIDRLRRSVSQTELHCRFDLEQSKYDGVTLGWTQNDTVTNKNLIIVTTSTDKQPLRVLATEDLTHEIRLRQPQLTKTYLYKVLLNPLPNEVTAMTMELRDLYGYNNLENRELELIFTNSEGTKQKKLNLNNHRFQVGDLTLEVYSAELQQDALVVNYVVQDATGKLRKDAVLDARIRLSGDSYAVPTEGECVVGKEVNQLKFTGLSPHDEVEYVLNLVRLGEKLALEPFEVNIK